MTWTFEAVAPLRFGYGRRPGEAPVADRDSLLAQVPQGAATPPGFVSGHSPARIKTLYDLNERIKNARKQNRPEELEAVREERRQFWKRAYGGDAHDRVLWSVTQPLGFYERLAFFWADHFTVSAYRRSLRHVVGPFEAEAIRPFIAGDFVTLLRHAALHPAMLVYLDQYRSYGPNSELGLDRGRGLNENLAREIIELHSLSVDGPYSQSDVRQFAELLTGLVVERKSGRQGFNPKASEPGTMRVLDRVYGASPDGLDAVLAALEDLARHPATARHIARKLAVHFLSDSPPDDVVRHMEAAYRDNDTALMPVYRALLEHPASWQTFGQKVRQPFDFLVTTLRVALPPGKLDEVTARQARMEEGDGMMGDGGRPREWPWTLRPLSRMGQLPWSPPGPDGWAEAAEAWLSPQGLTERLAMVAELVRGPWVRGKPKALIERAFGDGPVDRLGLLTLEAGNAKEARALILASPEFQRR